MSLSMLLSACATGNPSNAPPPLGTADASGAEDTAGSTTEDTAGFVGDVDPDASHDAGCVGLECKRVSCPSGAKTTISGVVYAPTKVAPDPLYNAIVYVPNAKVSPFPAGVACEKCGTLTTGSPIVTALSGPDGKFVLSDVPVGTDIPLVVQLGRWRRQVTIPNIEPCVDNPIGSELTRLPRNQSEGDIPLHALSSGRVDGLECVLRKIGIDDAEFTRPTGSGRIHLYTQNGTAAPGGAVAASSLWSSVETLKKYDLVLFPCEGAPIPKARDATHAIIDYTSAGGRVFATHYSYVWIQGAPTPFPGTASWNVDQLHPADPLMGYVDTSFPKGVAFAQWLFNVKASTTLGEIPIHQPRHDVESVVAPSQSWITSKSPATLQHYTFNTPVGVPAEAQCGRVVYSDFHVLDSRSDGTTFPATCDDKPLSPQEKVIEFMLFDLASCVQKDKDPPVAPPPPK